MKLIFAQGNPGPQYAQSRHNVGFIAIDYLQQTHGLGGFQQKTKFSALISEWTHQDEKIILAKPTTFYNLTGQSARAISDFYRIAPEDILVIHDELVLDFGTLRVRSSGSDAGNKGIRSLIAHLGPEFWRLRVGIKNDLTPQIDSADFVLSGLTSDEKKTLESQVLPGVNDIVLKFLNDTLEPISERHI